MKKFKARDITMIIVSLVVLISVGIFIIENMDSGKSSGKDPSSSFKKIEEPVFSVDYNQETLDKLKEFTDYGSPEPSNLGKQNIFKLEEGSNPSSSQEEENQEEPEEVSQEIPQEEPR